MCVLLNGIGVRYAVVEDLFERKRRIFDDASVILLSFLIRFDIPFPVPIVIHGSILIFPS